MKILPRDMSSLFRGIKEQTYYVMILDKVDNFEDIMK
jgi:hypothetical protein